jgi:hypothetical protein
MSNFREKYLKYKMKYIQLKNQLGGVCDCTKANSNPECIVCSKMAAVESAAPTMINVHVRTMAGKEAIYNISPNAKILDLKLLIARERKFVYPLYYRQKLILMPSYEPLADNSTLAECGILDGTVLELILGKMNEDFPSEVSQLKKFSYEERNDEFAELLSVWDGKLHIFNLDMSQEGESKFIKSLGIALRENTSITDLKISTFYSHSLLATTLADVLKVNKTITTLNLSYNAFNCEDMIALADALKVNQSITTINLSFNNIGNNGALALAEALRINHYITRISLSYNNIEIEGRQALKALLVERPELKIKFK